MNIKEKRMSLNMTQKEFIEKTGKTGPWIRKVESGAIDLKNITLENAIKIADALGIDDLRDLIR